MNSSLSKFLTIAMVVVCALFVFSLTGSRPVAASGIQPLSIDGHVYDSSGHGVSGASVTVLIVQTGATSTDPDGTDSNGLYQINPEFDPADYSLGNTIRVTAVSGLGTQSNETPVSQDMYDFGLGEIDVNYQTAIPEFGSTMGVMVAACLAGTVAIVAIGKPRK
jgi:hypothetical protein